MAKDKVLDYVSKKFLEVLGSSSKYSFSYWGKYGLVRVYIKNKYDDDIGYIQIYPKVKVNLDVSIVYNRKLKEIFSEEKEIIEKIINEEDN